MKKRYNKHEINGMLIILNKLIPKLKQHNVTYIVAEASDLPDLEGHFVLNNDTLEVSFKTFHKRDCEYYIGTCDKGKIDIIPCIGVNCGEFKLK